MVVTVRDTGLCTRTTHYISRITGAFRSAEGLFGSPSSEGPFGSPSSEGPFYVVDIQCPPALPTNCTFTTATPPGTCTHENDVGVFCPAAEGTPTLCATGDIRLAGGVQPREGRVEICINNQWGTICDDSWDERGVNLVCSALYNEQSEFVTLTQSSLPVLTRL